MVAALPNGVTRIGGKMMQPWLASSAALLPWMRNSLRPNVFVSGVGSSAIVYGPVFGLVCGSPIVYVPGGMGPTFGTLHRAGLLRPSSSVWPFPE
ncbi:MAG TPA: hypothetical protein VFB54_03590 [Burkholderiales bacterium]|nr:hypothetical protein [Burkholderiales bacterium]